ncbi:hypothetical protein CEXT_570241 [Caerostris extrusa]|uniref:Uncharacterized protein n=1 Tax=Caerostris extrusa TaxID=172846 RepID=A0AAV4WB05_CAEEX|nr:hypothetical protein CEXT_570241 [Caerostris extrusa]
MMQRGQLPVKLILQHNKAFFPTCIKEPSVKKLQLLKYRLRTELRTRIHVIKKLSYLLFPNLSHGQESQYESTHLLQPSEDDSAIMNPNPQFPEAWNPNHPVHAASPVAEPCFLPGFQETFGQGNVLINQMAAHSNASSEMQCSGMYHMDEMPSHFISDFDESDNASTNRLLHHNETSIVMPILAVQNEQHNPIPPTDAIDLITSKKRPKKFFTERSP